MNRLLYFKRLLLKIILKFLGVGSMGLMVSCAKYGVEINTINMQLNGTVVSKDSIKGIEGIQIEINNCISNTKVFTNENGIFIASPNIDELQDRIHLSISDIDGSINGSFLPKDTVLLLTPEEINNLLKENIEIKLIRNE